MHQHTRTFVRGQLHCSKLDLSRCHGILRSSSNGFSGFGSKRKGRPPTAHPMASGRELVGGDALPFDVPLIRTSDDRQRDVVQKLFAVLPFHILIPGERVHELVTFAAQIGSEQIIYLDSIAAVVSKTTGSGIVRKHDRFILAPTSYARLPAGELREVFQAAYSQIWS